MDPYQQQPPPPRQSHGCLWGCLGTVIAIVVVVAGVFGFGAWYFYKGFEHDSRIQAVMQTVRNDPRAEAVLGKNIKLLQVEVHTFDYSTGRGGTASYVLRLSGSQGEGDLKVNLDITGNGTKITLMILTGKDGQKHYLKGAPPPNPMMDRSI
ncbi:MAG TPA: cytochrome c oxidase assembly factor Coa1 family protein [Rhizomicrobium sp.]|nr:cytochrome c oxidase assembly factor Coa1 family protein [Rhizomicrobium sp.]